jgi:hypothetical protein
MVEIAVRALSPAVSDTFTALTCIDWLSDGLCNLSARWGPHLVHLDPQGYIRVIAAQASYGRLVSRAHDKIRQAAEGMPAIMIRQLDGLGRVMTHTQSDDQRAALMEQADMILRLSEASVGEPLDRADVRTRYDAVVSARLIRADREPQPASHAGESSLDRTPAPQRDEGPDGLDDAERPGPAQESVGAGEAASDGEGEHVPPPALLQSVHGHHEGERRDAVGGEH